MKTYKVEVTRLLIQHGAINIKAADFEEAEKLALDSYGEDITWENSYEGYGGLEVYDITKVA